jgi:hypothetical protein
MGPFSSGWVALLLLVLMCTRQELRAQISGATVTGVVQDSSRAVLPAAKLRLINTQTGAENDAVTYRDGSFALPGILAGTYTLQVESRGFATTQLRGITLTDGDTRNLLIRMKVGSVAETVNVDASGLAMNTTTAAVGMVADRELVENLPLNGRSFPDLILLSPGIVTQNPQVGGRGTSTVGEFSVNGQQPGTNSFYVDGVAANVGLSATNGGPRLATTGSIAGTTALGTTQTLVSVDALEQFQVLTSTYSAEYGRTSGGQFNFVTRSGVDGFHGSAYDYYRQQSLDTKDYFSSGGNGYIYNQFDSGGTLGGPIVLPWATHSRRKGYLFGSYEGLYLSQPTPLLFQYVPTFSNEPFPPAQLEPIYQAFGPEGPELLDASGQPTGMGFIPYTEHALPSHVNATTLRFDQILSPRASLFVRYAATPSFGQTLQLSSLSQDQVQSQTVTVGSTVQFQDGKSNEARLGYATNDSAFVTTIDPYYPSLQTTDLVSLLGVPSNYESVRAQVYVHANEAGDSLIQTDQTTSSLAQWNVRDTVIFPVRNHLLKVGIDERKVDSSLFPTSLLVRADFFDRSSMTQNSLSQLVVSNSSPAQPRIQQLSLFADDIWKVSDSLNLSLGLRWELNPAPTGKRGLDAFTVVGDLASRASLRLAPRGTPLWHTAWFNLAPRFGAAWVADNHSGRELVLRGGAGVFFDSADTTALNAFHGVGFYTSEAFSGVPLPITTQQLDVSKAIAPPYTNTLVYMFPRHLQEPYSLQWNLGVEKAIGKNQSLTVSYVGASGRRLLREQRRDIRSVNPMFGDVSYFPGGLTSNYQAMQAKFQRTLSKGIEGVLSYTWAHSFDYGSTSRQLPLRYGTSDLDVRNNLEGGFTWTLPTWGASLWSKILVGHWTFDGRLIARTAFPVDLAGNFFFDAVEGTPYYSGVDLIPNRPLYHHSSAVAGGRAFNGGLTSDRPTPAFTLPSGLDPGNAPRNLVRGFDLVQTNLGAKRDFQVYERLHLEIGAEMFNVLNHPNLGYIDPYLTDSVFGVATRMLNQSFGNTGALYQQGGPRALQFHARVSF